VLSVSIDYASLVRFRRTFFTFVQYVSQKKPMHVKSKLEEKKIETFDIIWTQAKKGGTGLEVTAASSLVWLHLKVKFL